MRFSVRSARLADRILRLGRYDGPIEATLVDSRDFCRGAVDGDGSLGILATGYAYFGLVGSRRLLEAFLLFLRSNNLAARMTIRPDRTIFQIATAGYTAEKIVCFLYDSADVALDRKAASATEIVAARAARLRAERSRLAQISDWYQSGESLKQIGSRLGVSNVTILRWMVEAGIPRRTRYGGRRPNYLILFSVPLAPTSVARAVDHGPLAAQAQCVCGCPQEDRWTRESPACTAASTTRA